MKQNIKKFISRMVLGVFALPFLIAVLCIIFQLVGWLLDFLELLIVGFVWLMLQPVFWYMAISAVITIIIYYIGYILLDEMALYKLINRIKKSKK